MTCTLHTCYTAVGLKRDVASLIRTLRAVDVGALNTTSVFGGQMTDDHRVYLHVVDLLDPLGCADICSQPLIAGTYDVALNVNNKCITQ